MESGNDVKRLEGSYSEENKELDWNRQNEKRNEEKKVRLVKKRKRDRVRRAGFSKKDLKKLYQQRLTAETLEERAAW